jgi:hypothetical protein
VHESHIGGHGRFRSGVESPFRFRGPARLREWAAGRQAQRTCGSRGAWETVQALPASRCVPDREDAAGYERALTISSGISTRMLPRCGLRGTRQVCSQADSASLVLVTRSISEHAPDQRKGRRIHLGGGALHSLRQPFVQSPRDQPASAPTSVRPWPTTKQHLESPVRSRTASVRSSFRCATCLGRSTGTARF